MKFTYQIYDFFIHISNYEFFFFFVKDYPFVSFIAIEIIYFFNWIFFV